MVFAFKYMNNGKTCSREHNVISQSVYSICNPNAANEIGSAICGLPNIGRDAYKNMWTVIITRIIIIRVKLWCKKKPNYVWLCKRFSYLYEFWSVKCTFGFSCRWQRVMMSTKVNLFVQWLILAICWIDVNANRAIGEFAWNLVYLMTWFSFCTFTHIIFPNYFYLKNMNKTYYSAKEQV